MTPKNPKKPLLKKSPLRIPKDAQVKIIEISPRTFIIPLLLIALGWSLYTLWAANQNPEVIKYNDEK